MKKGFYLLTAILLFYTAKSQTKSIDVVLNGNKYNIEISKDSPVTMVARNSRHRLFFTKTFPVPAGAYSSYGFVTASNKLYFINSYNFGGSGSLDNTYCLIMRGNSLICIPVYKGGELNLTAYNKNGNDIIVFEGIWDIKNGESHFQDHRYRIVRYEFKNESFVKVIHGKTIYKYPSLDDENISLMNVFKDIKRKEPSLLKSINPSEYK